MQGQDGFMVIELKARQPCPYPMRLLQARPADPKISARWGFQGRCGHPASGRSVMSRRLFANDNAALPTLAW